jgi:hypothetical protein
MLDRSSTTEPTGLAGDLVNGHDSPLPLAALEQRVQSLEEAVAQLRNTEQLEERLTTRVAERVSRGAPVAQPTAEPAGFFTRLPRALLPMAVTTITPPGTASPTEGTTHGVKSLWAFLDVLVELRTIWRIYVDPRYRLTWVGKVVPVVLLTAILTSWFWLPGALLLDTFSKTLATIFVKFADLVLAFFLYKALSREARRYRDCFPEPPRA